jgi:hypothetical protein
VVNTLTAPSFGMLATLSENSWISASTTSGTVFAEGWKAQYPIRGRRTRIKTLLAWTITDGIPAVAACATFASPLDYEFATHRLPNNTDGVFAPYSQSRRLSIRISLPSKLNVRILRILPCK